MIDFSRLRLYTQRVPAIKYTIKNNEPYFMVYFSENSNFLSDYPKLNLRFIDFRYVIVPTTKIPRTYLSPALRKLYMDFKLKPLNSNSPVPKGKSLIVDLSPYLSQLDVMLHPMNYRQRAGFLMTNLLQKSFHLVPGNYRKILLYSIDLNKPFRPFKDRKIFPILQQIKDKEFLYPNLLMNSLSDESIYQALIKDNEYNYSRLYTTLRNVKAGATEEKQEEEEVERATKTVMQRVEKNIPEKKEKIQIAVTKYLKSTPAVASQISKGDMKEPEELDRVAATSIMYGVHPDKSRIHNVMKRIPANKSAITLRAVDKLYADDLLGGEKAEVLSNQMAVQSYDLPKIVGNKVPSHLFQKRQIDFEVNLKKDFTNTFKILEKKQIPLKLEKIDIVPKPTKAGEIQKSDVNTVKANLTDGFGNKHTLRIDIPAIDPKTGTFRVNGKRKCLINQLILRPITFPKPYDSKFESAYSAFHIYSKKLKRWQYLELYMGSYRIPLGVLLAYSFGFEQTLKEYDLSCRLEGKKPKDSNHYMRIGPKIFLIFEKVDTLLKDELCQSFMKADFWKYYKHLDFSKFPEKEFFADYIIKSTGRVDSTYSLDGALDNIVDPVATQVLINEQLPVQLDQIMKYMASKVVLGYEESRTDLAHQRIRNSEILVHIAQKHILAAYSIYRQQILAGNKRAMLTLPPGKVMSDFSNSQLVVNMEYSNPIEEMATMTRTSPIGKNLGGIPDKVSIAVQSRDVHPSYFGNIDPVDTPEGEGVGVAQQLAIDAQITSSRGLFSLKPFSNDEKSGLLSAATSIIPFVENNEGSRVMFSANQARQIVPLKDPENPMVQSGYESLLVPYLSESFVKRAETSGEITKITETEMTLKTPQGKYMRIDITPAHLHSGSGKDTLSVFKPSVKIGDKVKSGQIIAEGCCMSGGMISMGRSLLTAMMPYKGYNFEDGIVISDRLVREGKLTSLHGVKKEDLISPVDRILHIVEIGQETKKGEPLLVRSLGEIEELLGVSQEEEDVEYGPDQRILKSPGGRVVDISVYCNVEPSKFPKLKPYIEKTDKQFKKKTGEPYLIRGEPIKGLLIEFKIEQELKITLGDKLCNRYGNKGVITKIEKEEFMPMTPWGEHVDIVFNPLGVLNRMNVGQIYELYSGLVAKELANRIMKNPKREDIIQLVTKVLSFFDTTVNKEHIKEMTKRLSGLSAKNFDLLINQIKESGFFPIVVPPFQGPNYKQMKEVLKFLDLKSEYKLKLPEYGTSTSYAVPVGYQYINKLEHLGDLKIHSRSIGPKTGKTFQPTSGKSREGGQRLGEGDTYSLISYDCLMTLSELLGPLSDDLVSKNEIISDIIQTGEAKFRPPKSSPSLELLNSYFISLMLT